MSSTNKKNINDYCEESLNSIYENLSPEYKKQSYKNISSICSVYEYMEFEILCMRDICKSNNCLNYFKKLNILPLDIVEVEIEDKYFPEKKLYRNKYDKLFSRLINIRPYIEYYYDIYKKYMKITVENIPPNSTIEFYNSPDWKYNSLAASINLLPASIIHPFLKSMKIIKVCNKIVKFKCEGDINIKYRTMPKKNLKNYLHHTCYKIY